MKKAILRIIGCLAILTSFLLSNLSADIVEGRDYIKLEKEIKDANSSLIKIFSYDCPFCYKFDKTVTKSVMEKLPGMRFIPYHLVTKGVFGEYANEVLATMVAIDEDNNTSLLAENSYFNRAKFALYSAYNDKKERWGFDAENKANVYSFLKTALDSVEMSFEEYEKLKEKPEVKEILKKWGDKEGDAYMVAKIQGIPAYVVDGKYLINTNAIRGIDHMVEIVKELHELK